MSTAAVREAMRSAQPKQSTATLQQLRDKVREARDLQLEIESLGEKLTLKNAQLTKILGGGRERGELVDLFEELGSTSHGLEAEGNVPAYDVKIQPFYSGSLPKDPEKRADALDHIVNKWKMPDLVKHSFEIDFGMGDSKRAKRLASLLKKEKFEYSDSVTIHGGTLTAEIRRRFESGKPLAPAELEKVGGFVGKVAKLKKRDIK